MHRWWWEPIRPFFSPAWIRKGKSDRSNPEILFKFVHLIWFNLIWFNLIWFNFISFTLFNEFLKFHWRLMFKKIKFRLDATNTIGRRFLYVILISKCRSCPYDKLISIYEWFYFRTCFRILLSSRIVNMHIFFLLLSLRCIIIIWIFLLFFCSFRCSIIVCISFLLFVQFQ